MTHTERFDAGWLLYGLDMMHRHSPIVIDRDGNMLRIVSLPKHPTRNVNLGLCMERDERHLWVRAEDVENCETEAA